jgi:hypothetical protein
MNEADPRIHQILSSFADHTTVRAVEFLPEVYRRARRLDRRHTIMRTGGAALIAALFVAAVFLSLSHLGRPAGIPRPGEHPTVSKAGAHEEAVVAAWGGELVWQRSGSPEELNVSRADSATKLTAMGDIAGDVAVSPLGADHGILAFVGGAPAILLPDGRTIAFATANHSGATFAWSPDGASVAFESCPEAFVCSLMIGSARDGSATDGTDSSGRGVSWSPDGTQVAYIDRSGALSVLTVASGKRGAILSPDAALASTAITSTSPSETVSLINPKWAPSGAFIGAVLDAPAEGYVPLVITSDGRVVGAGATAPLSPPELVWRARSDELYLAEGAAEGGVPDSTSTLSVMADPNWTPTPIASRVGEAIRGLFSSPDGSAILWQTLNEGALAASSYSGPLPYRWTVVDANGRPTSQSYDGVQRVLSWGP